VQLLLVLLDCWCAAFSLFYKCHIYSFFGSYMVSGSYVIAPLFVLLLLLLLLNCYKRSDCVVFEAYILCAAVLVNTQYGIYGIQTINLIYSTTALFER
jgi:hypothetical protein